MVCFVSAWIIYGLIQQKQFRNDYKEAVGTITDIRIGRTKVSPGDFTLLYEYTVGGKKYTDGISCNLCENLTISTVKNLFLGKSFPVLFSRKKPSWNNIMIKKDMAINMNYTYPDSLLRFDSVLTCK